MKLESCLSQEGQHLCARIPFTVDTVARTFTEDMQMKLKGERVRGLYLKNSKKKLEWVEWGGFWVSF
jgi:hypothetical protein